MVRDQHVASLLRRSVNRPLGRIEREHHTRDLALRVTGEQPTAVPLFGPLGGKRPSYGAFDVADGDTTHSAIDLQPPDSPGNATLRYPASSIAS